MARADETGAKSAADVQQMFDQIAPRYDLLNHLLSGGLDVLWRRRAARLASQGLVGQAGEAPLVIDLCCGTGDLSAALARRLASSGGAAGRVIGLDFSPAMVAQAVRKFRRHRNLEFLVGDALAVPLADGSASAVTCAFGMRNVASVELFVRQCCRLLRPGGRLVVLEFFRRRRGLRQSLFDFYFRRIVPILGRCVSGHRSAYSYLPSSVAGFLSADDFAEMLKAAGLQQIETRTLAGGAATIVCGVTATDAEGGCK